MQFIFLFKPGSAARRARDHREAAVQLRSATATVQGADTRKYRADQEAVLAAGGRVEQAHGHE